MDGNKYLVDLGNGQLIKASFSGNLAVDQMVVVGNSRGNWEVLVSKALAAKGIVDVKIEG
ncbi:MAG: hypothetical protein U9R60_16315 [Bacteroidota bacterium]|nr:hypothetical protein [Bacteroidota bacterium]